jgi:hypothetical protein
VAFEKVLLATGEGRSEYIQRRLTEGATVSAIHGEINAAGLYSGPEGKSWPTSVVIAQKAKVAPKPAAKTALPDVKYEAVGDVVVPPQYEGILTPEDIAEIQEEAAEQVRAAQRKKARATMLADARAALEREAVIEMRRGAARGDMVDVSIDLATYAPFLRIDGEVFYHGATYRVGRDKAKVLQEQMQRSWAHERSLAGPETQFFRQRNMLLNGRTGAVQGAEGLQR